MGVRAANAGEKAHSAAVAGVLTLRASMRSANSRCSQLPRCGVFCRRMVLPFSNSVRTKEVSDSLKPKTVTQHSRCPALSWKGGRCPWKSQEGM